MSAIRRNWPSRFLTYFLVGMCAWLWRDKIVLSKWIALICFVVMMGSSRFHPWFSLTLPFTLGYMLLWLGYGHKIAWLNWTEKTDLSYGTYLYAWPVQQVVAMHPSLRDPWMNFLIAAPATLVLAYLSWTLVEKRFLAMKGLTQYLSRQDFDPGRAEGGLGNAELAS